MRVSVTNLLKKTTVSLNFLMFDDVLQERDELFNSLRYYISPNNEMTYSVAIDPVNILMQTMTSTLED